MPNSKIIAFDLDDTLCIRDNSVGGIEKYLGCRPVQENIDIANECFDAGHRVVIYTARGMSVFSGNRDDIYSNLYELTRSQLDKWGIKYHQLVMGKIHFDILVDDKVVNISDVSSLECIEERLV